MAEITYPCFIARLDGARPGRTVLLRGDMDALPIVEETGLDFASHTHGHMHACGHDTHSAMLVSAARKRLGDGNVAADSLNIDVGDLPRPDGRSGDRRKSSRRKGERRTANRPTGSQPDRRKGDRRQRERRSSAPPKE